MKWSKKCIENLSSNKLLDTFLNNKAIALSFKTTRSDDLDFTPFCLFSSQKKAFPLRKALNYSDSTSNQASGFSDSLTLFLTF